MNRPYTAHSTFSLSPTESIPSHGDDGGETVEFDRAHYEYQGPEEYDDYGDIEEYYEPIDRRWIWVAGVAGVILLVAVICTVVILGGGDSGSVSKTIAAPTPTSAAPAFPTAPPVLTSTVPPAAPAPSAPLSPETVTTVAPSPTASAAPPPVETAAPSPRTITYQVTG